MKVEQQILAGLMNEWPNQPKISGVLGTPDWGMFEDGQMARVMCSVLHEHG